MTATLGAAGPVIKPLSELATSVGHHPAPCSGSVSLLSCLLVNKHLVGHFAGDRDV